MAYLSPYDYMVKTRLTAKYPPDMALPYLALGLVSEIGEFAATLRTSDVENFKAEAGDVLWYCFRILDELDQTAVPYWGSYAYHRVWINVVRGVNGVDIDVLLYGKVTRIADAVKKAVRDNGGTLTSDAQNNVLSYVYNIIAIVGYALYQRSDLTLEQVAAANIAKLASRLQRGVISGSGDNR